MVNFPASSLSDSESEELEPDSDPEVELDEPLELDSVISPSSAPLLDSSESSPLSLVLSIHIFKLGRNLDMVDLGCRLPDQSAWLGCTFCSGR